MNVSKENIIGQLVAVDYRAASVFKSHKIDFCCNGNRTINDACVDKNIDVDALVNELNSAMKDKEVQTTDFQSWDMDLLADYIEKKYHRYVESKIPELSFYLNKVARVHGERHPELIEINNLFAASANELMSHMKDEETLVFPYVRKLVEAKNGNGDFGQFDFDTVESPIEKMMKEHDNEGSRFRKIALLTDNYTPPFDACNTYRVSFALLQEFEENLHHHIHLENNILFPKAIAAEKELSYA